MIVQNEDIVTLETTWKNLVTSDTHCTIFQTWEWISEWLTHFSGQYDIKVLCARDSDSAETVAILPLMRAHTGNEWKLLGDSSEACPDHLDIIADPARKFPVSMDFMRFIGSEPELAVCNFDHVAEWSPLREAAAQTRQLFWNSIDISRKCHVVPLTGGWPEVEKGLSDKFRKRLPYYERRLRKEFDIELAEAKPSDNILLFREMVRLHSLRWNQLGQRGAFHDENVCRFHEGIINKLSPGDMCKIYYLAINKKVVSVIYGYLYRNVYYFYNSGFDPEYSKFSPGVVTLAFAIKQAANLGCISFDFLRGNELYKDQWPGNDTNDWNIRLYRKNRSNFLPVVLHESRKFYLSLKKNISTTIRKNAE